MAISKRSLFCLLALGLSCAVVAQAQERVIKSERLAPDAIEVLEISNLQVDGKPVVFGQRFLADDEWAKGISFDVRNVSGKVITHFEIGLSLQGDTGRRGTTTMFFHGVNTGLPGMTPTVRMQPSEMLHATYTDKRYEGLKLMRETIGATNVSEVALTIETAIFEDDTSWRHGQMLRRSPDNPLAWTVIGKEPAARKPAELPVTKLPLKDSATVSVLPQSDAPLLISLKDVFVTDWPKVTISVNCENKSDKLIRAFSIRHDDTLGESKRNDLFGAIQPSLIRIMKPGQWYGMAYQYQVAEAISNIALSVDFVEFEDGTTWGADTFNSADRLAGRRAGINTERTRLLNLLLAGGAAIVMKAVEAGAPEPPAGHTPEWEKGFAEGIKEMYGYLRRASNDGGTPVVEQMLKSPPASLLR